MTRYMALIFDDESAWAVPGAAERGMELHTQFGKDFADVLRGGEYLHPRSETTVVRADGDDFVITDGPFAEAKEVLGGYYLIEADDKATALEIAKRVPVLAGYVELREIVVFEP